MTRFWSYVLLPAFIIVSCKSKQEKTKPVQEEITESVYASGIIKSTNQYKVFSSVNGLIAEILIKEGGLVKKGDVIIRLVSTNAALNTDNALLAAGYASMTANSEKLDELRINSTLAKNKMDADALLFKRQQNLWNQNIGSRNEMEQRELAYKSSATASTAASLRYTQLEKQISFQGKQSGKSAEIASSIENDFSIKSDVDGKVYNIISKKGEMANTLSPVAIIGDASVFMIELQVDEYDIGRIKIGQEIALNMESYKGQLFGATVARINPIMDEKSKSFKIEALFTEQPAMLYPNLTCEANIVIQKKAKAITIPELT